MALRLRRTCPQCGVRLVLVDWGEKIITVVCPLCGQKTIFRRRRKRNGENN